MRRAPSAATPGTSECARQKPIKCPKHHLIITKCFLESTFPFGHFIDTLLLNEYKDNSCLAFEIWSYFRGITAPTFFSISGLIFTYLLLKSKDKNEDNKRVKKGITRGLMLIGIGYLLRIPVFQWLNGYFSIAILKVDVLQIIGLSLIAIVLSKTLKTDGDRPI